jgi:hypothetical protein
VPPIPKERLNVSGRRAEIKAGKMLMEMEK